MNNPFLTNDLLAFCNQARVSYLDTLARKQMSGSPSKRELEASQKAHTEQLDKFWDASLNAAFAGDIRTASLQLAYMITWWGLYKADQDLLAHNGTYLDPADPDTVNDFHRAVMHQAVFWATELQSQFLAGEAQRKNDLSNQYANHNAHLFSSYHQMVLDQGSALTQAHGYNNKYAEQALQGIHQAALAAEWYATGVDKMYTHGENVMHAAVESQRHMAETLHQQLPREVEEAQVRAERRKIFTRGIVALVIIIAVPLLFLLAYGMLQLALHMH